MSETTIQSLYSFKSFKCPKCKHGSISKVFTALVKCPVELIHCMSGLQTGDVEVIQGRDETICFVCDGCGYTLRNSNKVVRTEEQLLDFISP